VSRPIQPIGAKEGDPAEHARAGRPHHGYGPTRNVERIGRLAWTLIGAASLLSTDLATVCGQ